jgi:hypothetical protein
MALQFLGTQPSVTLQPVSLHPVDMMVLQAVNVLHASADASTSSGELAKDHTQFLLASWMSEHLFHLDFLLQYFVGDVCTTPGQVLRIISELVRKVRMVWDTKSPPLLYNQNRKVKFDLNSYPSDQNALISKGIIYTIQIFLKFKIAGEIVFAPIRLAIETETY